jgi:hypothetical protein
MKYVPRCLSNVLSKSGPVHLIDVVIVKRYPIYYSEYMQRDSGQALRFTRSRETVELIQSR